MCPVYSVSYVPGRICYLCARSGPLFHPLPMGEGRVRGDLPEAKSSRHAPTPFKLVPELRIPFRLGNRTHIVREAQVHGQPRLGADSADSPRSVIPPQGGIQSMTGQTVMENWIPACAGMTPRGTAGGNICPAPLENEDCSSTLSLWERAG